jgi:probable HAF family extracellular repeat protein
MFDLGTLGGAQSFAYGVNSAGYVVGKSQTSGGIYHAFRYHGETGMVDYNNVIFDSSVAYGINDSGHIVGTGFNSTSGQHKAFVDTGAATFLIGLGGAQSYAYSINSSGHAVGFSQLLAGGAERAFLYVPGVGSYDLEALAEAAGLLVPFGDGTAGFMSFRFNREFGISINDTGQIVGYGQYYDGMVTTYERAFLMNVSIAAIPEPSTYAALFGLAALGPALWQRRRRRSA